MIATTRKPRRTVGTSLCKLVADVDGVLEQTGCCQSPAFSDSLSGQATHMQCDEGAYPSTSSGTAHVGSSHTICWLDSSAGSSTSMCASLHTILAPPMRSTFCCDAACHPQHSGHSSTRTHTACLTNLQLVDVHIHAAIKRHANDSGNTVHVRLLQACQRDGVVCPAVQSRTRHMRCDCGRNNRREPCTNVALVLWAWHHLVMAHDQRGCFLRASSGDALHRWPSLHKGDTWLSSAACDIHEVACAQASTLELLGKPMVLSTSPSACR